MDAFLAAFGAHVRSLRRGLGLSQEETAHRAGIHVTYLSGIERGVRNPALRNIGAIAGALGVRVADLFTFDNPEQPVRPEMPLVDSRAEDPPFLRGRR